MTEVQNPTIRTLVVEPLSAAAFAPFGTILAPEGRERLPINTYGDKLDLYREPFETDQPIEWFIVQGRVRPLSALFLERHAHITQAFIPLNGDAFVTVVAPADAPLEDGLPAHATLRAFIVPGSVGIQLYRSTWHENPFPLKDNQTFLVTSHQALTRGHQQTPDASLAQLPLDLERRWFREHNVTLNITVAG